VFYLRRAYRILPLYFLVVTLSWLTFQASNHGWLPITWGQMFQSPLPWWSYFTFTQNFWFAAGYFTGVLSITWSLAVEEQFYLVLPVVIRHVSEKYLALTVAALTACAPVLRMLLMRYYSHGTFASYVLMPCRADALGLGVLTALLVRRPGAWKHLVRYRMLIYGTSFLLLIVLFLIASDDYSVLTDSLYGLEYSVLALFYTSVLVIVVTGEDRFTRAVFCNKALMRLGMIAYGTYLFHYIFVQAFHFAPGWASGKTLAVIILGTRLLASAGAIALAALSWRFFEKPILRRGQAYRY
jgi:peptidoglycan/LPS O-acetylase OafA/YrhL